MNRRLWMGLCVFGMGWGLACQPANNAPVIELTSPSTTTPGTSNPSPGNPTPGTPTPGDPQPPVLNPAGPWPLGNVKYGAAQGILETPVIGMSTDAAQNLWVVTHQALYLLKAEQAQNPSARFRRYDAADGLHLQTNPAVYCDDRFGDPNALPRCPIYGAAADPGILAVEGGGVDEVFVGYAGAEDGTQDANDPNRHSGKLDRVRLRKDGTLDVFRIDVVSNNHGMNYWHNRTVYRMVYDHRYYPGDLYVGFNHGVTLLRPNQIRAAQANEWLDTVYMEYMADHLHPRVCKGGPCVSRGADDSEAGQLMGEWMGVALAPDGHLWVAGKWSAGKIAWHQDLKTWFGRGGAAFLEAFGDPYPRAPNAYGFTNEPVFKVPVEGDPVHLTAVAVAPDERVWFASGPRSTSYPAYGVAVWNGRQFTTFDPVTHLGMDERVISDLLALPDGRILLATPNTGLTLYDPATQARTHLRAPNWLPDNRVKRLELDERTVPFSVHVATESGATRLRVFPE